MANNNFFLGQDPLLFQQSQYQMPNTDYDPELIKQMNDTLAQYKKIQNTQNGSMISDYIGDLDNTVSGLSHAAVEVLSTNDEYIALSTELSKMVQKELINVVRWKINSNPLIIQNIKRQKEIINGINKDIEEEQRKKRSELNDYVRNYSNITFEEYKRIKNGETEITTNNKKTTKIKNE